MVGALGVRISPFPTQASVIAPSVASQLVATMTGEAALSAATRFTTPCAINSVATETELPLMVCARAGTLIGVETRWSVGVGASRTVVVRARAGTAGAIADVGVGVTMAAAATSSSETMSVAVAAGQRLGLSLTGDGASSIAAGTDIAVTWLFA